MNASPPETPATHEHTMLQPADHEALFAALDNPPAPTAKLRKAFAPLQPDDPERLKVLLDGLPE